MCGIAGIFYHDGRAAEISLLKRMTDTLVHRGPDGEGLRSFACGGFGHRRLSIIDIAGGAQPMANENETVWITFNGEAYNFRDLRRELEERGHKFATNSDTEAIVHLYEEIGEKVPERIRGMFAFGLWDANTRTLLLARDRIGKKPLYWFEDTEGIFFASEIKALLALDNCPREIDPESVDLYLTYQSVPGSRTIFCGVRRLDPACRLIWRPGGRARIEKYWEADWASKTELSYRDAMVRLRELILDATRCRLISDVPLGAFLSGGVDSSAVVAAMAETSDAPVKTFSIGFPEKDFTETKYARMVAEKFGTEHEEFVVEPDAVEVIPKLVWHYDQPYADSSALPTYYLSKMTRQRVTVALNGDGGDEFFGGYDRYRAALYHHVYSRLSTPRMREAVVAASSALPEGASNRSLARRVRRFAHAARQSPEEFNLRIFSFFDREMRDELYAPGFKESLGGNDADEFLLRLLAPAEGAPGDPIDRTLRADTLSYLPDTLLVKVDVATMAVSLEARSPLLDTSVMEFAASLPSRWKIGFLRSKSILKRAHHDILPHEVMYRRKMGFGVPLSHWFRGKLNSYLKEVLLDPKTSARGYFKPDRVVSLIAEHERGERNHANRLWSLLMFELWHREIGDRPAHIPR